MDLTYSEEEEAFRARLREWLAVVAAQAAARAPAGRLARAAGVRHRLAAPAVRRGLRRGPLGRARPHPAADLPGGDRTGRSALCGRELRGAAARGTHDRRGGQRRAAGALAAADPARRRDLVPGLQRTGRRVRPRRRCGRVRYGTATRTSSPAPRSGPRTRRSPTGANCSCAPTPAPRSTEGSAGSPCPWTRPGSPYGRCARSPGRPSSPRCSSTRCGCRSANRVGAENDGWRVTMVTLSFERGTAFVGEVVACRRTLGRTGRARPGATAAGTIRCCGAGWAG